MRIAYLSASIIPSRMANSVHVMNMCEALGVCGHSVTLFAGRGGHSTEPAYDYYGVSGQFELRCLFRPNVRVLGGIVYALNVLRSAYAGKFDVLYGRHAISLLLCARLGVPIIYEAHSLPSNSILARVERRLFRQVNFHKLVVISDALRGAYIAQSRELAGKKIQVAHDGAPKRLAEAVVDPANRRNCRVGYIGHLYPGKGMEIMSRIVLQAPDISIDVIGGTSNEIREWCARLDVPNISFHGHVSPSELTAWHNRLSIALAPYQERVTVSGGRGDIGRWMSPLKVFEYMAAGHAIIASDLPVLREVLQHGRNALLVAPNDPDEWIEAIRSLTRNRDLMLQLGRQAREDFVRDYTWESRAKDVLSDL